MSFFKMSKTVLKTLFRGPYTVKYPFGPKVYHGDITRGKITVDIKECIFCGTCQRKCPTKAILVTKEEKKWSIDRLCCITCGNCVESCPKKCLFMDKEYTVPVQKREKEVYLYA